MSFENMKNIQVDEELYHEEGKSYPAIVWHGKVQGKEGGFWTIDQGAIGDDEPDGWELTDFRFGSDPNADEVPVWKSHLLRCVPIGIRKRQIVIDDLKQSHYYPMNTKREERVPGQFKAHFQVMVMVPGVSEPLVIGLKGFTKTVCWNNPPNGRWAKRDFPVGAEVQLKAYADKASKQVGTKIPWLCTWIIDLGPVIEKGKAAYVKVGGDGNEVYMSPFAINLETGKKTIPTRYVGDESFALYQDMRRDIAIPWEKEWDRVDTMADASEPTEPVPEPIKAEEDEIPF